MLKLILKRGVMTKNITDLTEKLILDTLVKHDEILNILALELNISAERLKSFINSLSDKMSIFIDGGSRGNPGESGIGIITVDDRIKKGHYFYIGNATNNEAEYLALIKGLNLAFENNKKAIDVFSDSELLCNQISGSYKIKSKNLLPLYKEAMGLISRFNSFKIEHIPREQNSEADRLVNIAIDSKSDGEIELTVAQDNN